MSTVILAARECVKESHYNSFLVPIHGKPCIAYVLNNLLEDEDCVIVVNQNNNKLIDYLQKCYENISIVSVVEEEHRQRFGSFSILCSLYVGLCALDEVGAVKVNFADTLCHYIPPESKDFIIVSSDVLASERWTMVEKKNGKLGHIYDKIPGLDITHLKAFAGVMQASDALKLKRVVEKLIAENRSSFADLLEDYSKEQPLTCCECSSWFDFGHRDGLIKAQTSFYNSRDFNRLHADPTYSSISKISSNVQKLGDEYNWYRTLPDDLQFLVPRTASFQNGIDSAILKMEMYGYPPLSELFILGDLGLEEWQLILRQLFEVHKLLEQHTGKLDREDFRALYLNKTWKRYEELKNQHSCWETIIELPTLIIDGKVLKNIPFYREAINEAIERLISNVFVTIMHGDYCLSNILFDISVQICKLIDPRGRIREQTIYGDPRYDIAKLRHSVVGGYDFIVHGLFSLHQKGNTFITERNGLKFQKELNEIFDNYVIEFGFNSKEIQFIEALLFLSMLPLHKDDLERQKMFYLVATEKFNEYFGNEI